MWFRIGTFLWFRSWGCWTSPVFTFRGSWKTWGFWRWFRRRSRGWSRGWSGRCSRRCFGRRFWIRFSRLFWWFSIVCGSASWWGRFCVFWIFRSVRVRSRLAWKNPRPFFRNWTFWFSAWVWWLWFRRPWTFAFGSCCCLERFCI